MDLQRDIMSSSTTRLSDDVSKREIPSFIEPRPPLVTNPEYRRNLTQGTNLLKLFEEDSDIEDPELVQVYLRIKPSTVPNTLYEIRDNHSLITSVDTISVGHGRRTQNNVSKMYSFTHIFRPAVTQKEIFECVVKSNLRKLADGHSYTLLTYGASGSGKTYTLMGTETAPGLVPRSLEYVFKVVEAAKQPNYKPCDGSAERLSYAQQEHELQWVKRIRHVSAPVREKYHRMSARLTADFASTIDLTQRTQYYVWVSFVEIYNEAVFDLLVPSDPRTASKLRIREDTNGFVYVKGATQAFVRSGEEAYSVMVTGRHNLHVASTGIHNHSSRSHCIFTITMLTETPDGVKTACVKLCDLAGSERFNRTNNTGTRMAESRAINSSLHVLERCLHMLRRKQQQRPDSNLVPYRESKLTRLLGSGLSGTRGEAVTMLVTINSSPDFIYETKHVLQLASVARDIYINTTTTSESSSDTNIIHDTTVTSSAEIMKLRADKECLQFELAQSLASYKELQEAMETERLERTNIMKGIVDDIKSSRDEYHRTQIEAMENRHKFEMNEFTEETKSKLQYLYAKQNKLSKIISLLENELCADNVSIMKLKKMVCNLRVCLEGELHEEEQEIEDLSVCSESEQNQSYKENSTTHLHKLSSRQTFAIVDLEVSGSSTCIDNDGSQSDITDEKSILTEDNDLTDNNFTEDSQSNVGSNSVNAENIFTDANIDIETKVSNLLTDINLKENKKSSIVKDSSKDGSLILFEKFERETEVEIVNEKNQNYVTMENVQKAYFDNINQLFTKKVINSSMVNVDALRSPSIVKDDIPSDYNSSTIKKLFGDNIPKTDYNLSVTNNLLNGKEKQSIDIFEEIDSPQVQTKEEFKQNIVEEKSDNITSSVKCEDYLKTSIYSDYFSYKHQTELKTEFAKSTDMKICEKIKPKCKVEPLAEPEIINPTMAKENNTIDEFENIYNDLSVTRATEFDLLVSHDDNKLLEKLESCAIQEKLPDSDSINCEYQLKKYNLRPKVNVIDEKLTDDVSEKTNECAKQADKTHKKRINLRLRRNKNTIDEEQCGKETNMKLKNIENLIHEYCDVTMDMPAPIKTEKDIPSAEELADDEENLLPLPQGIQSCPSKSITRSRRKLFTPRAEPLEESHSATGDSNERVCVPRPSYRRGRARRKL